MEGIDFKDDEKDAEKFGCDDDVIVQNGDFGWPQIITGDDNATNDPVEKVKIQKSPELIRKLCAEGYDFIMLDFKDGDYFIQRNAMVLVDLIREVNRQLDANGSSHPIAIVGASMGGQVSRLALRFMENEGENHNCGLWISYDSPNEGANIPLGLQYAVRWSSFYVFTSLVSPELFAPATKQLLVYHYKPTTPNNPLQDVLRTNLYNDPNMTYPSVPRRVAIANGSGFGYGQGYNAGDKTLEIHNVLMDMNIWAVPNQSEQVIFNAVAYYLFPIIPISASSSKIKNAQPYDNAAGGSRPSFYSLAHTISPPTDIFALQNSHAFIPSSSALGMPSAFLSMDLHAVFGGIYPVYHPSFSPFHAVYAPFSNEEHVEITTDNIGWAAGEIAPHDLYLQNKTITGTTAFEARNTVTTGSNVDPVPGRQAAGSFVADSASKVDISAGDEIIVKDDTWFKPGSDVHLYIKNFSCAAQCRSSSGHSSGSDRSLVALKDASPADIILYEVKKQGHASPKTDDPHRAIIAYPNPFTDHAHFDYEAAEGEAVNLSVYNLCGSKVAEVVSSSPHHTGLHTATLKGQNLPPGVYHAVLKTGNKTSNLKLVKTE